MYELTIFKSQFDNKTHKTVSMSSWVEFVELLQGLSNQKGVKGGVDSSPLISPAIFEKVRQGLIDLLVIGVVGVLLMWMIIITVMTWTF